MRLLFGTWSASGPLRPMIPLIRAAQAAEHEVVVMGDRGLRHSRELSAIPIEVLPDPESVIAGFDETGVKGATEALPPAERPAFEITNFLRWGQARAPAAREQAARPAPRRQIGVVLDGCLEVEVSSGERRRIAAGTIVFLEDTTGSGHITRILEPATYLQIHLA